jgi:hypothetical protein
MKLKNFVLAIAGFCLLALGGGPADAQARVDVGINIDLPVLTFQAPPELAVIPGTYVYYVPDIHEDIYFYHGQWYRPWNNRWHRSKNYNGPWAEINRRNVPSSFSHLPSDYRHSEIHKRIHYNEVSRNWKRWENDRHWEKEYDWWRVKGENNHERGDRDGGGDKGNRGDHPNNGGR